MQDPTLFKESKSFSVYFAHKGSQYSITVTTPDLRDNEWSTFVESGPLCAVDLSPDQLVRITYRSARRGLISEVRFCPEVVRMKTPLFGNEWSQYPYYLEFEDIARGLRFTAYLDSTARVAQTRTEALNHEEDIDSLIFPSESEAKLSA